MSTEAGGLCAECLERETCHSACKALLDALPSIRQGESIGRQREIVKFTDLPESELRKLSNRHAPPTECSERAAIPRRYIDWDTIFHNHKLSEIAYLCITLGYTQTQAAQSLGVSQPTISDRMRRVGIVLRRIDNLR